MIKRIETNCGDDTCSSCVIAGDFIFLGHHAGGYDKDDVEYQMHASFEALKETLHKANATLNDMVQINLYLKNTADFKKARVVFYDYFDKDNFPARMTTTTDFLSEKCLCMLDGTAYSKKNL